MVSINARQQQKRDTAANWETENPVLLDGEIGLESDTGKFKFGNGTNAWKDLEYSGDISDLTAPFHVSGDPGNDISLDDQGNVNIGGTNSVIIGGKYSDPETKYQLPPVQGSQGNYIADVLRTPIFDGNPWVITGNVTSWTQGMFDKFTFMDIGFFTGPNMSMTVDFTAATGLADPSVPFSQQGQLRTIYNSFDNYTMYLKAYRKNSPSSGASPITIEIPPRESVSFWYAGYDTQKGILIEKLIPGQTINPAYQIGTGGNFGTKSFDVSPMGWRAFHDANLQNHMFKSDVTVAIDYPYTSADWDLFCGDILMEDNAALYVSLTSSQYMNAWAPYNHFFQNIRGNLNLSIPSSISSINPSSFTLNFDSCSNVTYCGNGTLSDWRVASINLLNGTVMTLVGGGAYYGSITVNPGCTLIIPDYTSVPADINNYGTVIISTYAGTFGNVYNNGTLVDNRSGRPLERLTAHNADPVAHGGVITDPSKSVQHVVTIDYSDYQLLNPKDPNTVYNVLNDPRDHDKNSYNLILNSAIQAHNEDTTAHTDIRQMFMATKPHLWEAGTEYDFKDGSFGQRFQGTITASANTRNEVVLVASGVKTVERSNVMFQLAPGDNWYSGGYPATTFPNTVAGGVQVSTAGAAVLGTIYSSARTDAPYDVWIVYTKLPA